MEVINRTFISRPYIPEGDSYGELKDTLERLPFMVAVGTRYLPGTETLDPCIVASCQMVDKSIQTAFACAHKSSKMQRHTHLLAAVDLVKTEFPGKWENLAVLGVIEHSCGFLFAFGEDGLNT